MNMNDDTSLDITQETPQSPSRQPSPTRLDSTPEEIFERCSTDLVHTFAAAISQSAMQEAGKGEDFRQEFKRRLFHALIRTYVWSMARLSHETDSAEQKITKDVQELLCAERDQGRLSHSTPTILDRMRTRLSEMMAAVRKAAEVFAQF